MKNKRSYVETISQDIDSSDEEYVEQLPKKPLYSNLLYT